MRFPKTTHMLVAHTVASNPSSKRRQNKHKSWPFGVLAGGILIDIIEHLSATDLRTDWAFALWLQERFITRFGPIGRLDGLILECATDMNMLILARARYVGILGERALAQRLWVPGLEPIYREPRFKNTVRISAWPARYGRKAWYASTMYKKNGIGAKKAGQFVCDWKDGWGWTRKLWVAKPEMTGVEGRNKSSVSLSTIKASRSLPIIVVTDTTSGPDGVSAIAKKSGDYILHIAEDEKRE